MTFSSAKMDRPLVFGMHATRTPTGAVRGVEGNGQTSNCGRTNKDGIDFTKANTAGYERYLALYQHHRMTADVRAVVFSLCARANVRVRLSRVTGLPHGVL